MLNKALQQAQRRALHDAVVIIISDFDGADDETRKMVGAMARHNDVVALLVHDPLQSDLPASASMTVTDGELQIHLEVGRESVRQSIVGSVAGTAQGRVCLDAGTRRPGAAAQRRRGYRPAASPPARHACRTAADAAAAMVRWGRALADAQTKPADPLAGLIDIPLPQEVSLWPQTWPLRIAIVLVAVLAVLAIWRFVHRYRANRYRREALVGAGSNAAGVRRSAGSVGGATLAAGAAYGIGSFSARDDRPANRNGVAGISRPQLWRGRVLAGRGTMARQRPYQPTAPGRDELDALRGLVDRWIRVHHV